MFFREICASELNVEKLRHLEASMPITLCKLEMVFPPSLFDSMEHLPVHLAYEARWEARNNIDGCIRLRGFYAHLRTRSKIQGTLKDLSPRHTLSKRPQNLLHTIIPRNDIKMERVPRNDDAGDTRDQKSIFNFPGESWENVLGQLLTEEISE
ncbi:hypothetical protein K1719_018099 [Acacia pycnantha]|nr:hypothetical protein K1719_018099 [Acacia pycnantha]